MASEAPLTGERLREAFYFLGQMGLEFEHRTGGAPSHEQEDAILAKDAADFFDIDGPLTSVVNYLIWLRDEMQTWQTLVRALFVADSIQKVLQDKNCKKPAAEIRRILAIEMIAVPEQEVRSFIRQVAKVPKLDRRGFRLRMLGALAHLVGRGQPYASSTKLENLYRVISDARTHVNATRVSASAPKNVRRAKLKTRAQAETVRFYEPVPSSMVLAYAIVAIMGLPAGKVTLLFEQHSTKVLTDLFELCKKRLLQPQRPRSPGRKRPA